MAQQGPPSVVTVELSIPLSVFIGNNLHELKTVAKVLGDRVIFKPDAFIVDGYLYNCVCEESSEDCAVADLPCYDLCLDEGRYCADDPDHDLDVGLSGKDLVIESLRRMVIWDTHEMEWWDYVEQFAMNCLGDATDFQDPVCYMNAMAKSGISNYEESPDQNKILLDRIEYQAINGIFSPNVFVYEKDRSSTISTVQPDVRKIFQGICERLTNYYPDVCYACSADAEDTVNCILSTTDADKGGFSPITTNIIRIVGVFLVTSGAFVLFAYILRSHILKKDPPTSSETPRGEDQQPDEESS